MSRRTQEPLVSPQAAAHLTSRRGGTSVLIGAMSLSLLLVAGIAFWDEQRESAAALEDFALEQATLARSLAAVLRTRLSQVPKDARSTLEAGSLLDGAFIEQPGHLVLLVLPPEQRVFYATDGRVLYEPGLLTAVRAGRSYLRLSREESPRLGLVPRMAMAGLAQVDAGPLGQWGVAAVVSAERKRDRERRARFRLVFGVAMASGLVLAFGGIALRKQRKELRLEHELAIAGILRQRDERLLQAGRAATMGTLAMGITHELSTPLGVIAGRAEQLAPRVTGDERATRSVEAILEQVGRISQVIRGFLQLARGGDPHFESIEPARLIAESLLLVEHRFAKAGVALSQDVPGSLPGLRGDPLLLEHALVNLLLNACDACEAGGAVRLSARVERGEIVFAVADNGAGFPPGAVVRALEPFFSTKPVEKGTGLGLAVTHEIVKSHRGTLEIQPLQPRGTCVSLHVPLERAAAADHRASGAPTAKGGASDA